MQKELLRMENIVKTFPGVKALNNAAITVHAGEVMGFMGENGAGKSTMMNAIAGVFYVDEGSVILGGKDNGNGVAKILDADGNEVLVLDKNGAYAKGRYISISKDGTKRTTVNAGQMSVAGEDGATSGIISYLNNGITMQSYGGEGSSIVCRRDGTTQLWGPNGNSIIGGIRVPGGYTGKSGRAEFSDGSYLRFVDGICIGGETKEGGAF